MSDSCAPRSDSRYDLVVIGAGSAGFSAAITAADQGANVALIGHGTIGGTSVNVGCVPSKTMIRAAEALHGARAASRFPGLAGEAHVTDWRQLIAAKDDLVATLRQKKYIDLLPEYNGVAYVEGAARLSGKGVTVNGSDIATDRIIIATGSSPAAPNIPGLAEVPWLTSTTALELTEQPRSLLIIGGGYIGCELAQMFARTGTAVTLVTRSPSSRGGAGNSRGVDPLSGRRGHFGSHWACLFPDRTVRRPHRAYHRGEWQGGNPHGRTSPDNDRPKAQHRRSWSC